MLAKLCLRTSNLRQTTLMLIYNMAATHGSNTAELQHVFWSYFMLITGAETDNGGDSFVWMKPNISRNSSLGLCNTLF